MNLFIKAGKKNKIRKTLYASFTLIKENFYLLPQSLIWKILKKLKVRLKLVKKTIAGKKYIVPMPLVEKKRKILGFQLFLKMFRAASKQREFLYYWFATFLLRFMFEFKLSFHNPRLMLYELATENFMYAPYRWEF